MSIKDICTHFFILYSRLISRLRDSASIGLCVIFKVSNEINTNHFKCFNTLITFSSDEIFIESWKIANARVGAPEKCLWVFNIHMQYAYTHTLKSKYLARKFPPFCFSRLRYPFAWKTCPCALIFQAYLCYYLLFKHRDGKIVLKTG